MPDVWEQTCNLDMDDPADRNQIAYNNYTNLENYLNNEPCSSAASIFTDLTDIEILPNPLLDSITIDGDLSTFDIMVLDENGIVVNNYTSSNAPLTIDLSALGNGIFFLSLQSQVNSQLHIQQIIKGL